MNSHQAKQIPITDYLDFLGARPKVKGLDYLLYQAPYREDKSPSLKINLNKNSWYDLATGEGGNILDLVAQVNGYSLKDNPQRLSEILKLMGDNFKEHTGYKNQTNLIDEDNISELQKLEDKLEIKKIQKLQNKALIDYLKDRKISLNIAEKYLKEVYYTNKETDKNYFALGFENDKGGFELRNPYFKGGVGHKDITHIKVNSSDKVIVFEGFMDYLSALSYYGTETPKENIIVLNSTSFRKKAVEKIKNEKYSKVYSYLDRDKAGRQTLEYIKESLDNKIEIVDNSSVYEKYKDFNELLKNTPKITQKQPSKSLKQKKGINIPQEDLKPSEAQKISQKEKLQLLREKQEKQKERYKHKIKPKQGIKETKNVRSLAIYHNLQEFENSSQVSTEYNEETKETTLKLKPKLSPKW